METPFPLIQVEVDGTYYRCPEIQLRWYSSYQSLTQPLAIWRRGHSRNSRLENAAVSDYPTCLVTAGCIESWVITGTVQDKISEYRAFLKIWLIIGYYWKKAGIQAVATKNPGTGRKEVSKRWCNDNTLLIFGIMRLEQGGIFLQVDTH